MEIQEGNIDAPLRGLCLVLPQPPVFIFDPVDLPPQDATSHPSSPGPRSHNQVRKKIPKPPFAQPPVPYKHNKCHLHSCVVNGPTRILGHPYTSWTRTNCFNAVIQRANKVCLIEHASSRAIAASAVYQYRLVRLEDVGTTYLRVSCSRQWDTTLQRLRRDIKYRRPLDSWPISLQTLFWTAKSPRTWPVCQTLLAKHSCGPGGDCTTPTRTNTRLKTRSLSKKSMASTTIFAVKLAFNFVYRYIRVGKISSLCFQTAQLCIIILVHHSVDEIECV